ncbi:hypothetical protein [Xylanibacter muris]|uniref:Uncharacterized protein n=2 Tax=Xylanibacter muris TaxID=2736290 RepID=A0ABX2AK80_9BACT|nr:hypothetical protein [Xylanibacter muris]NPD91591.1 hypothetical protein [Xylanibacter muris]
MTHFDTEQDVAEELFELLSEARELYLQNVIADGKRYSRYVDDFINSHRYINCDSAVCRNCHEMNIHIVKGLLTECAHLIQPLFTTSHFSFEECMELRRQYDRSDPLPTPAVHRTDKVTDAPPLSFGCNFTQEQMTGIVSCANTYHLFCVSMLRVEDMEALFSCKEGFHIRVNNLRHVVILFDALLENSLIQSRWQSVLDKGRFLQSKDGTRFISASSLSSALSVARSNVDSISYSIRKSIGQLER